MLEKVKEKEKLSDNIGYTTMLTEVIGASSPIDLISRYGWVKSISDVDIAKKLGITEIKKYWQNVS